MKILYHHRVAAGDGQKVHITEMIAAFKEQGHEIVLVGPRIAAEDFKAGGGLVSLVRKILPAFMGELLELAYSIRVYFKLKKAIKKEKPDALYERANLFLRAGLYAARVADIPFILEVNAPLAAERAKHSTLHLKGLATRLEESVWRGADAALPVSAALGKRLEESGVHPARIHAVHNGINLIDYPEPSPKVSEDNISVGFIGFVRDWHRLDMIIELLAGHEFSHVSLEIAGDGPALEGLKQQVTQLGMGARVLFPGLIKREDVPPLMRSWDIALQPGVTAYASPLKLFEYMAAGLAIIAPDQPNIREVLTDRDNALLFSGDEAAVSQALKELIENPTLRHQLGQRARKAVIETPYTWAGNAKRIASLIEDIKASKDA